MSETQCFTLCIEHLQGARDCLRGLAILRADARWLIPVQLLDQLVDRIKKVMHRPGSRMLWLPQRTRN